MDIRHGDLRAAQTLVREHHYTHRPPRVAQCVTTVHDGGACVAACMFNTSPTQFLIKTIELVRLVRVPDCTFPLSKLVAIASREAARKCGLLISYADLREGHHGGIYQACSWNYGGEIRTSGVVIDGVEFHRRTLNDRFGTSSIAKLRALGIAASKAPISGRHFYWRAATNAAARDAASHPAFKRLPYPKPAGRLTIATLGA